MKKARTNSAAQAALKANAPKPSESSLEKVRAKIAEARDLELSIASLDENRRELSERLLKIRESELPALFQSVGINSLGIPAKGNLPAYDAELAPFFSASLPKDESIRAKAFKKFAWLKELTKHEFGVAFGKGQEKGAKKFAALLKKNKIEFENTVGVNSNTLTAEIRRRFRDGKPLPPADMELLGAYAGNIVKLTKTKGTDNHGSSSSKEALPKF